MQVFSDGRMFFSDFTQFFAKKFWRFTNNTYIPIFDTLILRYQGPRAL